MLPRPESAALRERILAHLARCETAGSVTLAVALGTKPVHLEHELAALLRDGLVRFHARGYELVTVTYQASLVRPQYERAIVRHLTGRKDSAHGVARTLGLSPREAQATCEALRERRVLTAMSVGSLLLYMATARGA